MERGELYAPESLSLLLPPPLTAITIPTATAHDTTTASTNNQHLYREQVEGVEVSVVGPSTVSGNSGNAVYVDG